MQKHKTVVISLILIFVGTAMLAASLFGTLFGFRIWDLWPLFVIGAGLLFVLPAVLNREKRGLGGLYIPGIPILANGALLLFSSVFHWWAVWEWLWPVELVAVALAFLCAALQLHAIWLLVPAVIIGANGILMQLCAVTGLWGIWAVFWVVEPLSVAAALFVVNTRKHSPGLRNAAVVLSALSVLWFMQSLFIVLLSRIASVWWLWKWSSSVMLIIAGAGLLVWGLNKPAQNAKLAVE